MLPTTYSGNQETPLTRRKVGRKVGRLHLHRHAIFCFMVAPADSVGDHPPNSTIWSVNLISFITPAPAWPCKGGKEHVLVAIFRLFDHQQGQAGQICGENRGCPERRSVLHHGQGHEPELSGLCRQAPLRLDARGNHRDLRVDHPRRHPLPRGGSQKLGETYDSFPGMWCGWLWSGTSSTSSTWLDKCRLKTQKIRAISPKNEAKVWFSW